MIQAEIDRIANGIWQAQAANAVGRDNATKRAKHAGIKSAAHHVACTIYPNSGLVDLRADFMRKCGFY